MTTNHYPLRQNLGKYGSVVHCARRQPMARYRASPQHTAPQWRWLYLLFPLMIGLLLWTRREPFSRVGHMVSQIGIVLLVYGMVSLWLYCNRAALQQEHRRVKPVAPPRVAYLVDSTMPDSGATEDMSPQHRVIVAPLKHAGYSPSLWGRLHLN